MSSVEPGDWMQSKTNPSAFLEVLTVAPDGGVRIRMAGQEANTTKRYLLNNYAHLEDDEPRKEEPWQETAHRSGSTSGMTTTSEP